MLSGEVFSVLLILMSHLSHTTATAVAEDNGEECYKELINSNVLTITISLPLPLESLLATLFSGPLQSITRSLVGTIQSTPGSMQRARAHLYGALLYYLMVAKQHPSEHKKQRGQRSCSNTCVVDIPTALSL